MSNEQYLTDLFIYQAESLAASDVDMIDGDDFEIEYDGGHSGDVSISGLMAEALKRLRQAEADRDQMAALAEDRRQFIVRGAELGYISPPWDKDDPAFRIFQECNLVPSFAAASHDARMKAEALEEAAGLADIEFWQEGHSSVEVLGRDLAEKAAEYRKQAEGDSQ